MTTVSQPIPQGFYKAAVRHGDTIYVSGMTPRQDGKMIYAGVVAASSDRAECKDAVELATKNALSAIEAKLEQGEIIGLFSQMLVYINSEPGFGEHAKVADHASRLLAQRYGDDAIGSRAAVGVSSLPSNAMVEVIVTAEVAR